MANAASFAAPQITLFCTALELNPGLLLFIVSQTCLRHDNFKKLDYIRQYESVLLKT
jgi:hypothetical protein